MVCSDELLRDHLYKACTPKMLMYFIGQLRSYGYIITGQQEQMIEERMEQVCGCNNENE